jgi:hypothetical protein
LATRQEDEKIDNQPSKHEQADGNAREGERTTRNLCQRRFHFVGLILFGLHIRIPLFASLRPPGIPTERRLQDRKRRATSPPHKTGIAFTWQIKVLTLTEVS